jgi:moderate conductance mechanosensitive channel
LLLSGGLRVNFLNGVEDILGKIFVSSYTWFLESGVKVILIIIGAYVVHHFSLFFIDRIVRKAVISDHFLTKDAEEKRENTLIRVFHGTLHVIVWVVAALIVLSEVGVDIGPLLAAAGVAGLAFGFGAQYMIRDIIAGLFIIMENQYRVGDVACLDSTCGLVEDINLRTTILRDLDGYVHHVPNGTFQKASNLSKFYARVNLNVGVDYDSNLEKVIEVVNRVGNELANDPDWKEFIIKPPQFLRVDDFADSAIMIKILGDTKPLKQWDVMGELRKRLKIAFDKEGISIPFPHRTIVQKASGK